MPERKWDSLTPAQQEEITNRALQAIRAMQAESERNGNCNMTLEEINAEINAVRAERRAREAAKNGSAPPFCPP